MRTCDYVAIVYDVCDQKSINSVNKWADFVLSNNIYAKLILVANKCDLNGLDDSTIDKSCFEKVVRCSAKSGLNVFDILDLEYDCNSQETVMKSFGGCF